MTEEITDPIEPPITERYRYNGVIHLFIHIKQDLLSTLIPEGVKGSSTLVSAEEYDEDGTLIKEAVYRQKTVLEFIGGAERVNYNPNGNDCTFLACKMDAPLYRLKKFVKADWHDWIMYADAVWPEQYEALTYAENVALVAEWSQVDEDSIA